MPRSRSLAILAAFLPILIPALARADAPGPAPGASASREALDQFEKAIRPLLIDQCVRCHGPEKQSSGLRLDSRKAILEGGNSGPAVVPGDPEQSTLILAVRHEDDSLKMPPKSKLDDAQVEALTAWVHAGAPWPAGDLSVAGEGENEPPSHWAFRPVRPVVPPPVSDASWLASPVDAFILAALEARGLTPSPEADRRTLIRRVTFDLIGLPPTEREIAEFEADPAPDAFETVVDRLLASPRYGERWGRHWLDVARYADTKGYVFQEERRYPFSFTYRDYVIRAFNDDLPYDRFVTEQIAADLVPGDDPRRLAALGFLTVGRRFLNNNDDIIDDRIDVVSRGLLGLTVACARCHDHKYDPIPAEDYYSLYGVFASSVEPEELPLIGSQSDHQATRDYEAERLKRQKAVEEYLRARQDAFQSELREKAAAYLAAAYDLDFNPRHPKFDERVRADSIRPELLRRLMARWQARLTATQDGRDPVLAPWHAFAAIPTAEFPARAAEVSGQLPGPATPIVGSFARKPPGSMRDVAVRYGEFLAGAGRGDGGGQDDGSGAALDEIRSWIDSDQSPFVIEAAETEKLLNREERNAHRKLEKQAQELEVTHPGAPARAMVVNDKAEPYNPRVFLRGNPGRPGKPVPRRFLKVLAGPDRQSFGSGSGRLDLARAIVQPDNPLTARVLANRVWMHHFGAGLVRSPSDFGFRSDPPSHPELLDYLAGRFVADGWSIKALHRLIVTSSAYRQRSGLRPDCAERDPQNLLVWRQSRRRLDFEAMRDAMLAVAGQLDWAMGGRPVSIATEPFSTRRTVYGFIDRQNLEGVFRTFDFASPDATSPARFVTTVPQQALFLMNGPFAIEQARRLAERLQRACEGDEAGPRIRQLYRWLFGRDAGDAELATGREFLESYREATGDGSPGSTLGAWDAYAQVLLLTNEFLYID